MRQGSGQGRTDPTASASRTPCHSLLLLLDQDVVRRRRRKSYSPARQRRRRTIANPKDQMLVRRGIAVHLQPRNRAVRHAVNVSAGATPRDVHGNRKFGVINPRTSSPPSPRPTSRNWRGGSCRYRDRASSSFRYPRDSNARRASSSVQNAAANSGPLPSKQPYPARAKNATSPSVLVTRQIAHGTSAISHQLVPS